LGNLRPSDGVTWRNPGASAPELTVLRPGAVNGRGRGARVSRAGRGGRRVGPPAHGRRSAAMWGTWGQLRTSLIGQGWDGSMRPRVLSPGSPTPAPAGCAGAVPVGRRRSMLFTCPQLWTCGFEPSRLLSEAPAMPPPIVCPSPFHHVSAHVACNRQVTGATSKEKPARFFQLAKN